MKILGVEALTAWKKLSMTHERMAAEGRLQKVKSPCMETVNDGSMPKIEAESVGKNKKISQNIWEEELEDAVRQFNVISRKTNSAQLEPELEKEDHI